MLHTLPANTANDNHHRKSISDLLLHVVESHSGPTTTIGEIVEMMGSRGYGVLILLLCLPNLIPLPLPGFSTIFGLPMAFVGLMLTLGARKPWLPKALRNKSIPHNQLELLVKKAHPYLKKIERLTKPRLLALTDDLAKRFLGFSIMIMAGVMALPIPLGNLVLAIPIALISLALIEKDGLLVSIGLVLGLIGLSFNATVVFLGVEGATKLFNIF